jgi:hypothetical protein
MPETLPASKLTLSFAKLVATPNETSWSQVYNAGNLFACVSLTTLEDEADIEDEEFSLQALGKDLFSVFQSEFFTLQEKNTAEIKKAIQTSLESVPDNVTVSLVLAFFKEAMLLVFIAGSGKVIMKRGEKTGVLLTKNDEPSEEIRSASGFIENADMIILETGQFSEGIPQETINQALELMLPNDIVEALSPQIHKQDNGAQAAIVISCGGTSISEPSEEPEQDNTQNLSALYSSQDPSESAPQEDQREEKHSPHLPLPKLPRLPKLSFHLPLNHRRRLFLNIALILAVLLVISIIFTMKKYQEEKEQALFQSIYPSAQQYYSEGQGLATVNASMSQNSYHKAEKLLKDGEPKFSQGSKDYQQIADLLEKVETALQGNVAGQSANVSATTPQPHSLLAVEQSTSGGLAYGQDDTDVYVITSQKITKISKADGTTKDIIKNNNDWITPVAIVPYDSNLYILDQKKGVLKYAAGSGGYGKSSYFKGTAPDLSQATGMAIDGSVWLLLKDGTILQYTSGTSNNLTVAGLLKSLSNPTKIVTDVTMANIYVLDRGNSRIVQFDKNGKYQNAYSASVLANASDFEVSESDKTITILSGGKVWKLAM